ncbi:hypothetical protein CPter91_2169 [Collimonas pratensis]|uniref:Uncharacterized protein n=1 Tax=Collimonas pratensis TaxID=279113 RepID=A0A127Q3Y7_9BURK|nr:hypothetical protein CPter91_2169 [Collimonas pratensis]
MDEFRVSSDNLSTVLLKTQADKRYLRKEGRRKNRFFVNERET